MVTHTLTILPAPSAAHRLARSALTLVAGDGAAMLVATGSPAVAWERIAPRLARAELHRRALA